MDLIDDPEIIELLGGHDSQTVVGAGARPSAVVLADGREAYMGGAYDGADRMDRAMALWGPSIQSVDDEILPDKPMSDARVRDTLRNDAYVAGGATLHKDNIVGAQYALNAKPASEVLGFNEDWEEAFQKEVEAKFTLVAESPNNWFDASSMNTLTGLIRLGLGIFVQGGEILASAEWMDQDPFRPFKTAIQMLDPDRLSNPPLAMEKPKFRGGIQQDRYGAPQIYHIRMAHPSDWANPDAYTWKPVPIRKPWGRLQMIHIIEQFRPDQTRGISEMVTALKECRVTKKFRDVVLQNAVVQATYAATIESDLPTEAIYQRMGGGQGDDFGNAISEYMTQYLGVVGEYVGKSKNLHIDGVKIPHLPPGSKMNLQPAGQGGPLGTDFEQSLLRYIAATLGVSYEQLSRDYTNTNYSSARAAMTETWKFMQARKKAVADKLATSVYRLWLEEAINTNQLKTFPASMRGLLYTNGRQNLMFEAIAQCDWIGASRGQIDEKKETEAAVMRIENNLSTIEIESARLGLDFRRIIRQRIRERKLLEEGGLWTAPKAANADATAATPTKKKAA